MANRTGFAYYTKEEIDEKPGNIVLCEVVDATSLSITQTYTDTAIGDGFTLETVVGAKYLVEYYASYVTQSGGNTWGELDVAVTTDASVISNIKGFATATNATGTKTHMERVAKGIIEATATSHNLQPVLMASVTGTFNVYQGLLIVTRIA